MMILREILAPAQTLLLWVVLPVLLIATAIAVLAIISPFLNKDRRDYALKIFAALNESASILRPRKPGHLPVRKKGDKDD